MNFDKERNEAIPTMTADSNFRLISKQWQDIASEHKYSYNFKWLGLPFIQMPQDIIAIQEVIWEQKPDYIIETGVARGGGVVFYASLLEAIGHGNVIGIDIDIREHNLEAIINHRMYKRIQLLECSSTSKYAAEYIFQTVGNKKTVVVLDSNHTRNHVLEELRLYSPIASYIIVLDTIIAFMQNHDFKDRPWDAFDNNPYHAVDEFLLENNSFEVDRRFDKLMITTAPSGYLKRKDK